MPNVNVDQETWKALKDKATELNMVFCPPYKVIRVLLGLDPKMSQNQQSQKTALVAKGSRRSK